MLAARAGLAAPVFLKQAIDALGVGPTQAAVNAAVAALLISGACRVLNSLAKEAQGPIFTPVSQVSPHDLLLCTRGLLAATSAACRVHGLGAGQTHGLAGT